jgi:diadenosine tetraphosphatase ApaH/serine/threonine PP2A family protein phosphatase
VVLHGGDLADTGSSPAEIVDRIRSLGWQGVVGNTDQMLASPETFEEFANLSPKLESLWAVLREMAAATRAVLGEERLAWLRSLPLTQIHAPIALVHASPESPWRGPVPEASHDELQSLYGPLGQPAVVYGHIHRPYIRSMSKMIVAHTGSVGLPYDGDRRASYQLIDDSKPEIRRVEYDMSRELGALSRSGFPHADWVARTLESGAPQMP